MNAPRVEPLRPVITTDQIQKRVKELGRQISDDYKGQTIQMLAVLENAFMFLADLVRAARSAGGVPVHQAQVHAAAERLRPRSHGDFLQPRAGHPRAAHSAGRRAGAFGRDQRVPDERPAGREGRPP